MKPKKKFSRRPGRTDRADRHGQTGHSGHSARPERHIHRGPSHRAEPPTPESDRPRNAETRWVGGIEPVATALARQPYDCRELWIEHELKHPAIGQIVRQAKDLNINLQYMSRPELDRAVKGGKHQGIAVRMAYDPAGTFKEWLDGLEEEAKKGMVVVALDQIQDPHNLGAISRSALQMGARCVVTPERRSSPVTQAVIQASAGAVLKIPVHRVVNLAQTLAHCKEKGFWVYGADAAGKDSWAVSINTPCILVVGSEGYGMRPLVRASCDELLRVPQVEHGVGSLNASCAATALLYEVARQKARPGV